MAIAIGLRLQQSHAVVEVVTKIADSKRGSQVIVFLITNITAYRSDEKRADCTLSNRRRAVIPFRRLCVLTVSVSGEAL